MDLQLLLSCAYHNFSSITSQGKHKENSFIEMEEVKKGNVWNNRKNQNLILKVFLLLLNNIYNSTIIGFKTKSRLLCTMLQFRAMKVMNAISPELFKSVSFHWRIYTKDALLVSSKNNQGYYVQYWLGLGKVWIQQLSSIQKSSLQNVAGLKCASMSST